MSDITSEESSKLFEQKLKKILYKNIIKYVTSYTLRNLPFLFSVLEQLNGKTLVMSLLGHDDPNVRYEALLAVQKLMVHNW